MPRSVYQVIRLKFLAIFVLLSKVRILCGGINFELIHSEISLDVTDRVNDEGLA